MKDDNFTIHSDQLGTEMSEVERAKKEALEEQKRQEKRRKLEDLLVERNIQRMFDYDNEEEIKPRVLHDDD